VPRHIDKPDAQVPKIQIGKPDIDRDPSSLFFRQTISVNAGERAHQRSLSVIDMPGSANNDRFHRDS
jgi:hypothetical protein